MTPDTRLVDALLQAYSEHDSAVAPASQVNCETAEAARVADDILDDVAEAIARGEKALTFDRETLIGKLEAARESDVDAAPVERGRR